jgi:hypothetical protein
MLRERSGPSEILWLSPARPAPNLSGGRRNEMSSLMARLPRNRFAAASIAVCQLCFYDLAVF